ncbi:MAG: AAA family ATPase [Planctomycetota bacterium]
MPRIDFQLPTVICRLDNDHCLGTLLSLPEVTAYGPNAQKVPREVARIAGSVFPKLTLLELHRHRIGGDFEVRTFTIELPPPPARFWTNPLSICFHAVCWEHENQAAVAYVPILDIHVVSQRPEELDKLVPEHIRFALMRGNANGNLRELVWLQRVESVAVERTSRVLEIHTARQRIDQRDAAGQDSVLKEVATELTGSKTPAIFELDDVVERLVDWLYRDTPQSVLLVGPSGVGKTAAVHKLAAQTRSKESQRRPIWMTSGARIVAGMTGLGMWQERCQNLCREAARLNAIVHFGRLTELLETGQSLRSDVGIGEFLRPAIARGELLAIAECTPEEFRVMERRYPSALDAFVRMDVQEPAPDISMSILCQAADAYCQEENALVDETAVATLDRLHQRYATYSAYPGRPLRFLKHLLEDSAAGQALEAADVTRAFSAETGLPLHVLDDSMPLDLEATRRWFQERIVGQEPSVDMVVDLLATVKADVARPDRPLASLLFIGPTGVGKTEMAKTLAEFLYQDRQRLTRLDMTEYADPIAVDRLVGTFGRDEGLLTSRVREQPFGVVLLDEFEKADPRFFDLLLQVLGEGRLTDGAGRLADFRNSVVIMTSNLGAESFGKRTPGFGSTAFADGNVQDHFEARVRDFLRPEMFNRIDRIVTFFPLSKSVLQDIARRELQLLQHRDGVRHRRLSLDFDDSLASWLVEHAYDPRYGARPLKRAIERHVLAPIANALNTSQADRPLRAEVSQAAEGLRVSLRTVSSDTGARKATVTHSRATEFAAGAEQCVELRRRAQRVDCCDGMRELRNDLYRLQKTQQRRVRARKNSYCPTAELDGEIARLESLASRAGRSVNDAAELEDQVLEAWYLDHAVNLRQVRTCIEDQSSRLDRLSLELYAQQFEQPDYVMLVVYGKLSEWRQLLAQAYYDMAVTRGFQIQTHEIEPFSERPASKPDQIVLGDRDSKNIEERRQANETKLLARQVEQPGDALSVPSEKSIGIAVSIEGPCSWLLFQSEYGLHAWRNERTEVDCLVHVSQARMPDYQPPFRIDRRKGIGSQPIRRIWNRSRKFVDNRESGRRVFWDSDSPGETLDELISRVLSDRVEEWIRS